MTGLRGINTFHPFYEGVASDSIEKMSNVSFFLLRILLNQGTIDQKKSPPPLYKRQWYLLPFRGAGVILLLPLGAITIILRSFSQTYQIHTALLAEKMYDKGFSSISQKKAFKWFQRAVHLGHAGAFKSLQDKPQPEVEKESWHEKPLTYGSEEAILRRQGDEAYSNSRIVEAIEFYKEGERLGDPYARFRVGVCYESLRNYEQAVIWYKKGAILNDATAMYRLGWIYQHILKVPQSAAISKDWFDRAKALGFPP